MNSKLTTLLTIILCLYLPAHAGKKKKICTPKPQTDVCQLCKVVIKYENNPLNLPALHYAILQQDVKAVDLLLKHGASPHTIDNAKNNCLYHAIKAGNIPLVHKFLSLGLSADLIPSINDSALWFALDMRQVEVAKSMIGKNVFSTDTLNTNVRTVACGQHSITFEQRKEIIRLMVKHGANLNSPVSPNTSLLTHVQNVYLDTDTRMCDFLRSLGAR
ncbi:MAG: ankyrin repeat domain-containing protein [Verrucomicrobia bacterium]|nr:ankyrin repeat domain-containing protein [Verrucomicrobiota bacterium]MBS0636732.1 ankyrin repeat domain-containing protein [Verrucomicrobiota bacterium]